MRKKKITETVPAGPLDDLPEKIVSDEDPEDDEDDDSEEAGEAEEPDEEKHSSSSREEPASPTSAIRKSLNLPGGVRSGNIPAVPSSDPEAPLGRDNNGDPIRAMRSDREIAASLRKKDLEEKAGKQLCRHQNDVETCSLCGTKRVPIVLPPPKPKEEKIPTVTAEQLTKQFAEPEEKSPPMLTVEQLREMWGLTPKPKPLGGAIPKPERKITAKGLGINGEQILGWQDRLIDTDTVIEWDLRPVLKPAPVDSCPELEKELAAAKIELEIRAQQHKEFTAAGQKRAAALGQAPYDPKRRKEFMQVAYRAEIAAAERVRELQARLREMKKASEDWGRNINDWTVERIPESKRELIVEHSLRNRFPQPAAKYRDFMELRDSWQEDPSLWVAVHPPSMCWPHTTTQQEYHYAGGMRRETWERIVILCAFLLRWFDPPEELLRKFPKLHDLKNKRLGTFGWSVDLDTEAEDVGAEEARSIVKDGGAGAQMTIHGKTWKKLKTFDTFSRMTYGSKDGDGDGFYGDMDSGDYGSEDE